MHSNVWYAKLHFAEPTDTLTESQRQNINRAIGWINAFNQNKYYWWIQMSL